MAGKTTKAATTAQVSDPNNPNLEIFNFARQVPDVAKKDIKAGKLKGYTNINPQWRLEKLTEKFGPVGFGWLIENIKYWTSEGCGECVMWCSLDLKVCYNGQWSQPINGIGGSKLYGKGQGDGINDEACKMAQTDAISVACKNLGFASDIYYGLDDTKYRAGQEDFSWGKNVPPMTPPQPIYQQPVAPAPQPIAQTQMQQATPAPAPAPAPVPAQQPQPSPQAQSVTITLDDAIKLATNAQSGDELVRIWNDFKKIYGTNTEFKKAISANPNNPSRR